MKIVIIDGIGEIKFRKHAQAKHIKISVNPADGVIVTVPTYLNYEFGINAVMGRYDWVLEQLAKFNAQKKLTWLSESSFPLTTHFHTIILNRNQFGKPAINSKLENCYLNIPLEYSLENEENQLEIKSLLDTIYRKEANEKMTKLTRDYAVKFDLEVNRITIRGQKTRWGSCSYQNNINLNFHLMKLPKPLIRYVVLHELAHTKEKNHGKGFWNLLDTFTNGKAKELDKQLKDYNHLIY